MLRRPWITSSRSRCASVSEIPTQSSFRKEKFFVVGDIDPLAELVLLGESSLELLALFSLTCEWLVIGMST